MEEDPLGPVLLYGTETAGHARLHAGCWPAWHAGREAEAARRYLQ